MRIDRPAANPSFMSLVPECRRKSHHDRCLRTRAQKPATDGRRAPYVHGRAHPRGIREEGRHSPPTPAQPRPGRLWERGYIGASWRPAASAAFVALILDTRQLNATLDRDDAAYGSCRRLVEDATEPLVISAPVLVEVDYWIHERLHPGILVALLDDIDAAAYPLCLHLVRPIET